MSERLYNIPKRCDITFFPSTSKTLHIPPGVAHTFDGLENVYTLNNYAVYLPDPEKWMRGETEWTMTGDILNIPLDIADDQIPACVINENEASDVLYQLVAENLRSTVPDMSHEYPFTEDVNLMNGEMVRLKMRKKLDARQQLPDWDPIENIPGAGWRKHLCVWTGGGIWVRATR